MTSLPSRAVSNTSGAPPLNEIHSPVGTSRRSRARCRIRTVASSYRRFRCHDVHGPAPVTGLGVEPAERDLAAVGRPVRRGAGRGHPPEERALSVYLLHIRSVDGNGEQVAGVRDVDEGETLFSAAGPFGETSWSPDGEHLVTIRDGSVTVFDLAGDTAQVLRQDDAEIDRAWYGPGDLIATLSHGAHENDVRPEIWDADRGEIVTRIDADTGAFSPASPLIYDWGDDLRDVAFDPRGARLLTRRGGSIEVWAVESGELIEALPQLPADINSMTFSPEGSRLAVGTVDGVLRLFDGRTFEQFVLVRGHETRVHRLVFSADGSRLASQDDDGLVRVWALEVAELLDIAHRNVTRSLTDQECRQYLHVEACPGPSD
jgi:WD40 repeat protein